MPVSEEKKYALFNHVLENEVLIIVALDHDVSVYQIIYSRLILAELFLQISEMINFFLGDISIQNFLVNSTSQCGGNTSFSVLNQVRLIVFQKEPFSDHDPLVNKAFLFVYTNLAKSNVEIVELGSKLRH